MNTQRTYGIEIETHSSISRARLATVIKNAIRQFGHTCVSGSYQHSTDSLNTTVWMVKPDSSLTSGNPFRDTHSTDAEVVSPVLKGRDGLRVLMAVCEAIEPHTKISRKCGLHVHHFVSSEMELRNMVEAWINIEGHVMKALPKSRQDNYYCKTWKRQGARRASRSSLRSFSRNCLGGGCDYDSRYVSLNLESYWLRNTVEFRAHSGTTEYEKIANWTIFTQAVVDKALACYFDAPVNQFQMIEILRAEQESSPAPRRRPRARRNTIKSRVYAEWIESGQSLDADDIAARYEVAVVSAKTWFSRWRNGKDFPTDAAVIEMGSNVTPQNDNSLVTIACDWYLSRVNHFEALRNAA